MGGFVTLVWIAFGVFLGVFIVASSVFLYHWVAYGHGNSRVRRFVWIYFLVSLIVLVGEVLLILSL